MNIYQKLIKARIELQNLNLKKSGNVSFKQTNYDYYELADFLPAINSLCEKHELVTTFDITYSNDKEKAILTITNATEPSEIIIFIAPTAEVSGSDAIKTLGAKITYMRRYMLMTAFEMVESDKVEKINRDLADELPKDAIEKIKKSKTKDELIKTCSILKTQYKYSLITPYFDKQMEILNQDEVKDQSNGDK